MCHPTDATNATPEGGVLPFLRPAETAPLERDPPRKPASSLVGVLDALSDTRATVDLVLLAAESLEPHAARSFGVVLDLVRGQIAATLSTLQAHAASMEA